MKTQMNLAALVALCALSGPAWAAPPKLVSADTSVEQARMVCNQDGRCWDQGGDRDYYGGYRGDFRDRGYNHRDMDDDDDED